MVGLLKLKNLKSSLSHINKVKSQSAAGQRWYLQWLQKAYMEHLTCPLLWNLVVWLPLLCR